MKIDTIIFDMGGVLVDLDLEICKSAFRNDLGFLEIDEIIDACHQKGIWGDLEEGKISADEFREAVMAKSREGVLPEDVDRAAQSILVGIDPAKVTLLKKLSESYSLYMLSNNKPITLPAAKRMFAAAGLDMDVYFKKYYMSYEMKMLKPCEKLFKDVMADIGTDSDRMLFIDDSQTNVDASIAAGLPAAYYQPGTDMAALFADLLNDTSLAEGGEAC